MSWQPIETAPRTRRSILVYCAENQCIYTAFWRDWGERQGWAHFGGGNDLMTQLPTHWMPLPDSPEKAQGTK